MSTSSVRTAQILQFPAGGRKARAERANPVTPVADADLQAVAIALGDAWYHEAAIKDAKLLGES